MKQQPSQQYRGYRLGGIRMSEDLAPELQQGREESERGYLYATHAYDKAHVTMLTEEKIISREIGAAILRAFREMEAEPGGAVESRVRVGGGQHSGEYYLIRKLGEEIGGWDHVGRSSACLGAVGRRITERDQLLATLEALNVFRGSLLQVASTHLDAIMPGYWNTQHCQPMTFGHYLLGFAQALERDAARGRECYARVNLNPGGGLVLTGSAFPINRERVAQLLGFDGIVENAVDAMQGIDHITECFCFLAMLSTSLSKLTENLDFWAGTECKYLDVADRYGAGSSMAMNMKTPMFPAASLVSQVLGELVKTFTSGTYFAAPNADPIFSTVAKTLHLYAAVLSTITFNRERSLEAVKTLDYAGGTDLGVLLVTDRQLPWRTAHQICGILFRHCSERGISADRITSKLLDEAAVEYFGRPLGLSTEAIQRAMDPVRIIHSRTHFGGAAPAEAQRQLELLMGGWHADEGWVRVQRERLASAAALLESAIDAILARN